MGKKDKGRRRSCGTCEACIRQPCQECIYCKKPEMKNRCSLRRCTQMEEPIESKGVEGEGSKPASRTTEESKRRGGDGKDTKLTDGDNKTAKKEKGVKEKGVKVKVEDGRKTFDGKSSAKPKEGNNNPSKSSVVIDKARIWKLLNDEDDYGDSDTNSEEGQRGKTWHGRSQKDPGGKGESGRSVKNNLRDVQSRGSGSKEVRSKDVRTKESKRKEVKQSGRGDRHRHTSSASRTKHGSKSSGSRSSKSEARPLNTYERVGQIRKNVEADSSTDPKGDGRSISQQISVINPDPWKEILSSAELLSQEPGPVIVSPFEASGLNDDIWGAVHREMVEVAEVLNSMNKNKGDDEQPSSSTARNGSLPRARRQHGAGH